MVKLKNLFVTDIEKKKEILKGVSFELQKGSLTALMGPNGSGKSSLASTLAGNPDYLVISGEAEYNSQNLLNLTPEERSQAGLFLVFQHPASIPGVSVAEFLKLALNSQENAHNQEVSDLKTFLALLKIAFKTVGLPWEFASRALNEAFSGGEMKRLELAQILILKPSFIIFDEIDSGLDLDAIKIVGRVIKELHLEGCTILVITHYQRLLTELEPEQVLILQDGQISQTGDASLVQKLEKDGYH